MSKVHISASIATGNLMNLEAEVKKLEASGVDSIHFDCMDGHFVPLLTIGVPVLEQMRKITKLHLNVHIMVTNPDTVFETYLDAGADTLTIPAESMLHGHKVCQKIKSLGKRAGVALNPSTSWRTIEYLLPHLDQVTVMAVNPGYSRQEHIASMKMKVQDLSEYIKKNNLKVDIEVDGGVNPKNAPELIAAGASILVAGGSIFNHQDYKAAVTALRCGG